MHEMTPEQVVRRFFDEVRTGAEVHRAHELLAPVVLAHQMDGRSPAETVARTPDQYLHHVGELDEVYGGSRIAVEELLADGDKVYVRWRQSGTRASGLASAVYRVVDGRITEYWIQVA